MDIAVRTSLIERLPDLSLILRNEYDPVVRQTFQNFSNEADRLLGGVIPVDTEGFEAKGKVIEYHTSAPDNAVNLGIIADSSEWPDSWGLDTFTNLRLTTQHLSDLAVKVRFDKRMKQLVHQGKMGSAAAYLAAMANENMAYKMGVLGTAPRTAVLGEVATTIVAASITDDTTNSRFTFDLALTFDAIYGSLIMTAFRKGAALQVCAAPASITAGITALRTFSAPIIVMGDPTIGIPTSGDVYMTVRVGVPYTTSIKAALWNGASPGTGALLAIADGDVVVPWAGATAGTSTLPTGGPNYGLAGLLHWIAATFTAGIPIFANIEDAGGATSALLVTDEDSPRNISRNIGDVATYEIADFLNPLVLDGGGNAIAANMALVDTLFMNLGMRMGKSLGVTRAILVNPLMHKAMRDAVGTAKYRFVDDASALMTQMNQKYGTTGFIYQGESSEPIWVGKHYAIPPSMVLVIVEQGGFRIYAPDEPQWQPGAIAGMWEHGHGSTGKTQFSLEACRTATLQIFPGNICPREWGAIIRTKP